MRKRLFIVAIITFFCFGILFSSVKAENQYNDIMNTKYELAVNYLTSLGIVHGFPDGTFKPNENVTRAQLAKMIVEGNHITQIPDSLAKEFTDLSHNHWAYDYIKTAVDHKIIVGYPDGTFQADNTVTYAEAMTMLLRAMHMEDNMTDKTWPTAYMTKANEVGLMNSIKNVDANHIAIRGDIAIAFYNMLQESKTTEQETEKKSGFSISYNQLGNSFIVEIDGKEYQYKATDETKDIDISDYENGVLLFARESTKSEDYVIFKAGITVADLKNVDDIATDYVEAIKDNIVKFSQKGALTINKDFRRTYDDYIFVNVYISDDNTADDKDVVISTEQIIKADDIAASNFEVADRIIEDAKSRVVFIVRGLEEREGMQ